MISLVERTRRKRIHVMLDVRRGVDPSGKSPSKVAEFSKVVRILRLCERMVDEVLRKTAAHFGVV